MWTVPWQSWPGPSCSPSSKRGLGVSISPKWPNSQGIWNYYRYPRCCWSCHEDGWGWLLPGTAGWWRQGQGEAAGGQQDWRADSKGFNNIILIILPILLLLQNIMKSDTNDMTLSLLSSKDRYLCCTLNISWHYLLQESLIVPLLSLEKQGRPSSVRGWVQLASFPENRRLCPVTAVTFYLSKVRLSCTNIALHNIYAVWGLTCCWLHFLVCWLGPATPACPSQVPGQVDDQHPGSRGCGHPEMAATQCPGCQCCSPSQAQGSHQPPACQACKLVFCFWNIQKFYDRYY